MHGRLTQVQLLPGRMNEAIAFVHSITPQVKELPGIKQFVVFQVGQNSALICAIYDSKEHGDAATPKVQATSPSPRPSGDDQRIGAAVTLG